VERKRNPGGFVINDLKPRSGDTNENSVSATDTRLFWTPE